MKSQIFSTLIVSILLLNLISALNVAHVQTTRIYVTPDNITVDVLDTFSINITVANVTGLCALEFQLFWKSHLMNASSYAPTMPSEWSSWFEVGAGIENTYNASHGRLQLGFSSLPASQFNGSHTFVMVAFTCVYPGETVLDLAETALYDIVASKISHETGDGYVTQEAPTPLVSIDPANLTVLTEELFIIYVSIVNAFDLYSFDFRIHYDADLLNIVDIVMGDFFDPYGPFISGTPEINNTIGRAWFFGSLCGNTSLASGNGTLAMITFNCTGPGESSLNLTDTILQNSQSQSVTVPPYLGDTNGDLKVDVFDLVAIHARYGSVLGDPTYDPSADLNNDTGIDHVDLHIFALNFFTDYNQTSTALSPVDPLIAHETDNGYVIQEEPPPPHGPTASFTYGPSTPYAYEEITLNATASSPGWTGDSIAPITAYRWDLDTDGSVDMFGMIRYNGYIAPGNYTVTLNVTDSQGLWDIASQNITVTEHPPLASPEEVIASGVEYLCSTQNSTNGSWFAAPLDPSPKYTSLILTKLQLHAYELGYASPFDPIYPYSENVTAGWEYLFSTNGTGHPLFSGKQPLSLQNHTEGASGTIDDPDTNGNGYGIGFGEIWDGTRYDTVEFTATMLLALHTSGTPYRPNDGSIDYDGDSYADTFGQIAQEAADWLAWAQGDSGIRNEGGYSWEPLDNANASAWADNWISGYAYWGLAAAEEFGCTIPGWVRTELNAWINNVQNPVDGDPFDGGSQWSPEDSWTNILVTGNLLFQMAFYGDDPGVQRFQDALGYVERYWHNSTYYGWGYDWWRSWYDAMYCVMRGLDYSGLTLIDLDNDSIAEHDWFDEFTTILGYQQNLIDGSWSTWWSGSSGRVYDTVWTLLTLERGGLLLPNATIAISGEVFTVGDSFSINVTIANVTDLKGFDFILRYDTTLFSAVNVTEGIFLRSGGETYVLEREINDTSGFVWFAVALLGAEVSGRNGSGILASIEFESTYDSSLSSFYNQTVEIPMTFASADLADSNADPIRYRIANMVVQMRILLKGDVDYDRDVDIFDVVRIAGVYGIASPDPRYDPNCDLDDDGDIDIFDIVIAAGHYGDSW